VPARLPRFVFLHAARAAGLASVTCSAASVAGFPIVRLLDGRANALAKFASGAGVTWTVNRGAAGLEAVDRLLIPAGHNLAGATSIEVTSDDSSGFTTPTTLLAAVAVAAGQIDKALAPSTEQYLRMTAAGTGAWELGELWLGRTRAPTAGVFDPHWHDPTLPSLVRHEFPSGESAVLELGDPKHTWRIEHSWLAGADLAVYAELAAAIGYGRDVFYLDPPDDAEPARLVELSAAPDREQDAEVPLVELTYTYRLALAESLA